MNEASRRTRRSFIVGGLSVAAGLLGLRWIFTRSEDMGAPWPLRKILGINEGIFRDFFSRKRLAAPIARVTGRQPRVNGDLGLGDQRDFSAWKVHVDADPALHRDVTMREILALPMTEYSFAFKCIEGWKEDMTVAGVRFSDFIGSVAPKATRFPYVGLETPDGGYYVSIDMESMLHPQTLLCHEMNGAPLSFENGAPLRLIIPVKYGIKSLKQVGRIFFSDSRPPDYWAERGYDWYAGL